MRTVPGPTEHVVIVGAGLGGLSAALHLAGAGRRVTVVEREPLPGGRCGLFTEGGYRFDTGPTVLTMPDMVAETLQAVGEDLTDWLTLHRLDPAYRARFADGSTIDVHADIDAMADEISRTCGARDAAGWQRYVSFLRELYRIEMPHFIARNLDSPLQLANADLARLVALGGFRRLGRKIGDYFADERLRRLFSFQAMYAGLAPAQALAIYAVITYMDCVAGVYFPEGGMHAVPRALADAGAKHGVEFRYDTAVTAIEVRDGRARGVHTGGGFIAADVVVVNADLPTAYGDLLPAEYTPRRVRRLRYSPSAVVLHAGTSAAADGLAHHTIDFGAAWDETFTEIIDRGRPMSDPSFLLTTPTRTDPSLAPPARHTQYALFPAPNLVRGPQWTAAERTAYRDHIVETLEKRGYTGFGSGIEVERLVTPADWRAQGIAAGAPFAAAHSFRQTGPFRPATLDRRIGNLVFCGSNAQPGVGVPMVLVSGRLAAERVTGPLRA